MSRDQELVRVLSVKKRGIPESVTIDQITDLVYQGADVNTPFMKPDTVKLLLNRPTLMGTLLKHGANVASPKTLIDGKNVLMIAIEDGNLGAVREILKHGRVNLEWKTAEGATAILLAAKRGVVDTVELLLQAGAKLYKKDHIQNGVLHYAAFSGSKEMIKYLLRKGLNPNKVNVHGETPLMLAADVYGEGMRKRDLEVLKELTLVSDFEVVDTQGRNVWARVAEDNDEDTAPEIKREMLEVFKEEVEDRMKNLLLLQKRNRETIPEGIPDDVMMKIATMGLNAAETNEYVRKKFSARSKLNTRK